MTRHRRNHSAKPPRDRAHDSRAPERDDLSSRVHALETLCRDLRGGMDVQSKRIAALQAHLDHLAAKFANR